MEKFEQEGAGERHEVFADRHGVRVETFGRWLYLLRAEKRGKRWQSARRGRRKSQAQLPLSLVEVASAPTGDARFELKLAGGRRLRVADVVRR